MFDYFYIINILFFSSLFIYGFSLMFYSFGMIKTDNFMSTNHLPSISIIIAIRNGEKSLARLIKQLKNQSYHKNIEFILVDDESTDKTKNIIQQACLDDSRFKYLTSKNGSKYLTAKKRALDAGIKESKYENLLFTDVDCQIGINWAQTMASYFKNFDYIIGFSESIPNKNLISKFQYIDFLMLMAAARGTAMMGYPGGCSGQNHGYKKSLFIKVNGFKDIAKDIGDDTLFLQMCIKKEKPKVTFASHPHSHVICRTENKLFPFLKQRIRWSGDANVMYKYNIFFYVIVLSTFTTNIILIYILKDIFINLNFSNINFLIIGCKILPEFYLFIITNKQLNKSNRIISFLFWMMLQPFYVFTMGIFSFFSQRLSWKGRAS